MKKVLFCLSLIFGLLVLNQVPSFGMEVSFETIGGLGDLGYGLIGGASFDFDGTEYVITDFDNLSEALKAEAADRKAREFLQAYCMGRGIPIPNIDPDLPATTAKEFYKSQYFDSANRTVWNNYKLGRTTIEQQEALRFPISPQSFSDWTGYSNFWYKYYISSVAGTDIVFEDVPEQYVSLVEPLSTTICGPFNSDLTHYGLYNMTGDQVISNDYTFYSYYTSFTTNGYYDLYILTNGSIYIIQDPDTDKYLTSYYFDMAPYNTIDISNGSTTYLGNRCSKAFGDPDNVGKVVLYSNFIEYTSDVPSFTSQFNTLSDALSYINSYFRHVNLFVNGACWCYVAGEMPIIPEFPDVVGGNDEDPIPAYDIVFPNTSDYEGTFDITSLFDALKEAIIGASDNDDSTDSTLTREKVTDTYRDKVGEAVGAAVKSIDDVMDNSFPIQGTLNYPALPPIPQIPLDNAFVGTTILSELIDACQQILPSPLALAFWGIIFILFIIGLIRILHK